MKSFLDNKTFWKNVKPFFSEKGSIGQKISLVDQNKIISEPAQLAEHFRVFFENAVTNLDLANNDILLNLNCVGESDCPIDIITAQFASHPSILKIKEKMTHNTNIFSFHEVNEIEIKAEIGKLNSKKATPTFQVTSRNTQ